MNNTNWSHEHDGKANGDTLGNCRVASDISSFVNLHATDSRVWNSRWYPAPKRMRGSNLVNIEDFRRAMVITNEVGTHTVGCCSLPGRGSSSRGSMYAVTPGLSNSRCVQPHASRPSELDRNNVKFQSTTPGEHWPFWPHRGGN